MGALDDFIENLKDTIRVRDAALIEIKDALIATESEMAKITELRKMVKNINPEYFSYDTLTKKHVLKEKGFFALGDAELNLDIKTRQWLKEAGNAIRKFVMSDPDIYYMLILEGEASREGEEYFNYNLSYKRALALIRFWQREKIDLNNIPNCELFIAGSGYYKSEKRQFTVQIIPKAGIIE
ncbi:MAG: hypothetical protein LUH10_01745 [Tannerellaceae bacterium]|nr:hypothetical protein [Tannerellaceae bacterium]